MKKFERFKRGATSFYVVAFSTLILVIIAASFATVMISEVTRTSNDDLSQSAYDSALAGVEDARLAYSNYQRCMAAHPDWITSPPAGDGTNDVNCTNIVAWMNNSNCDMVAKMLGRYNAANPDEGVFITEKVGNSGISMQQYYTCVKIDTVLRDYRANLTADNNVRVVKVQFKNATANDVAKIKLSWYMVNDTETMNFANYDAGRNRVSFYPVGEMRPATPPTLALQLVQTTRTFTLGGSDPDVSLGVNYSAAGLNGISQGDRTDRATMFFVPIGAAECNGRILCAGPTEDDAKDFASDHRYDTTKEKDDRTTNNGNYWGAYDSTAGADGNGANVLTAAQVARTNDQSISNLPYAVYCGDTSTDFACGVEVELPKPVQGVCSGTDCNRSDDTFMFLVTLPYGEPDTDFSMEFYDEYGNLLELVNTQITIDSTGRANDLYRRVETRLESSDTAFPYTYYAMELFGEDDDALRKDMIVKCENNFYDFGTNVTYTGAWPLSGFGNLSGSYHCN